MTTNILGISAYYHDSAACLLREGEIVAAAQEERFTRKKHDAAFSRTTPFVFVSQTGGMSLKDLKYVVFYDKPMLKFERLLETYVAFAPKGIQSYLMAMPVWMKEKVLLKNMMRKELLSLDPDS